MIVVRTFLSYSVLLCLLSGFAVAEEVDPEYLRVITERSEKIIAPLEIADQAKSLRVRDILVAQYQNLSRIHDGVDAQLKSLRDTIENPELAEQALQSNRALALSALHREFIARLSAELSHKQVEQIKDGMTYGVVDVTYNAYCNLLPDLTEEQKRTIRANLIEAREYAMDAGSSDAKHKWFGEYKGRINNYLSAAGYDLKQAERDLRERRQKEKENTESNDN